MDGYYLKDEGSLNHTFLNGTKIEKDKPRKLKSGCLIQLANEVFEWHCELPGVD
jgi:pSer/pThr/pTyr-binding forkhead associated (FHA) protein